MRSLHFFVPTNRRGKSGPRPLDGLNELVAAERLGHRVGNALKRRNGKNAEASCAYEMRATGWKCPDVKARVTLTFHEARANRDPDNIMGGAKFILDGITERRAKKDYGAGAIHDDSQKWIDLRFGEIVIDPQNVGCDVLIEVDDGV